MPLRFGKSEIYKPKSPGIFTGQYAIDSVQSHLIVLDLFAEILSYVRNNGDESLQKSPLQFFYPVRVEAFLASAEVRYIQYLDLIAKETGEDPQPLPPWDVAMIFHSHILTPLQFEVDIKRPRWKLDNKQMKFPLERLKTLIIKKTWSDPESQRAWEHAYPGVPYQVLDSSPDSNPTLLPYQNLEGIFICPNCGFSPAIDFNAWVTAFRLSRQDGVLETSHEEKPHLCCCATLLDFESLTDLNLRNELSQYDGASESISYIKGLNPILSSEDERDTLAKLLQDLKVVKAGEIDDKTFELFISRVKLDAPQFLAKYKCTPWPDLSCDLIAAVQLQEKFIAKIAKKTITAFETTQQRYLKFMYLLKNTTKTLVPSLEIDLFWHTHQLFGIDYHLFCLDNIGRRINHNSALDLRGSLDGIRDTKIAWQNTYGEKYPMDEYKMGTFKVVSTSRPCPSYYEIPYNLHLDEVSPTSTAAEINESFDQARKEMDKTFHRDLEVLCQIYESCKEEKYEIQRIYHTIKEAPVSSTSRLLPWLSHKSSELRKRVKELDSLCWDYLSSDNRLNHVKCEIKKYRGDDQNYGVAKIEHARLKALLEISNSKAVAENLASESPLASAWLEKIVKSNGYPWAKVWQHVYSRNRGSQEYDRYADGPPPEPEVFRERTDGIGGGCCGCG